MLHVACSTDGRFAADCAAMLASLMASNRDVGVHVYLLHDASLSKDAVRDLRGLVISAGGALETISETEARSVALPRSERFPVQAWYRVLLPELLQHLERILYVDADALITSSLSPLWKIDLHGCLVGAVTNPLFASMVPRLQSELGLPDGRSYFNSGVLLMDLNGWRTAGTTQAVIDFATRHRGLVWPDQDALNGVLHASRHHLHPRWNAMPGLWELPRRYMPYSVQETAEAAEDPAIVHFVGPHKPWHYRSKHPYRAEFFRYLSQTPWRGRDIEGRSLWQAALRPLPWLWAYRFEVATERTRNGARATYWRTRGALGRRIRG
jgi:lipopolysaccharide biosynthesis glycosyltransferase